MHCYVCNKNIFGKYYIDKWGHNICASHFDDGCVVYCSSCLGFTNKDVQLADGRVLCPVCSANAIKKGDSIDTLVNYVVRNLSKVGFCDLRTEDISVEVATAEEIASIRNSVVNVQNKGVIRSSIRASFGFFGGGRKEMQHTVYVLSHQTKIEFAGTLAHEMLHAWQTQNELQPSPKYAEGLCNLGSYYLFSIMPSSLTNILRDNMIKSPDPIYGDGLRTVLAIYEEGGWNGVIEFYKQKKYE